MSSKNGKGWNITNETWQKLGRMSAKELEQKAKNNMYMAKQQFAKGWDRAGAKSAHWSKILYAQAQAKKAWGKFRKKADSITSYRFVK
mgnify:CR=1 FL=1